jgi:hypothetical protein
MTDQATTTTSDGGAASTAATPADTLYPTPGADSTAASGGDTLASGADTAAPSTEAAGTDTLSGDTGNDSLSAEGNDSAPAPTYDNLKLADGLEVADALLGKFKETAANAKLDEPTAQAVLDLLPDVLKGQMEAIQASFQATQTEWTNTVNAMPEFTGANREVSLTKIGRVLDEFGTPEVRQLFDQTGAGNNPHLVQMFLKLADAVGEGNPTPQGRPNGSGAGRKSAAEILYPNTPNA